MGRGRTRAQTQALKNQRGDWSPESIPQTRTDHGLTGRCTLHLTAAACSSPCPWWGNWESEAGRGQLPGWPCQRQTGAQPGPSTPGQTQGETHTGTQQGGGGWRMMPGTYLDGVEPAHVHVAVGHHKDPDGASGPGPRQRQQHQLGEQGQPAEGPHPRAWQAAAGAGTPVCSGRATRQQTGNCPEEEGVGGDQQARCPRPGVT